jgi:hypothetical protein
VDSKLGLRDLDSWRDFYFSLFWACGLLVGLLLLFSSNNLVYFTLKINKNTQWRNPLISLIFLPKHGMKIKYRARLSQNHKLCIIIILICNPRHEHITAYSIWDHMITIYISKDLVTPTPLSGSRGDSGQEDNYHKSS